MRYLNLCFILSLCFYCTIPAMNNAIVRKEVPYLKDLARNKLIETITDQFANKKINVQYVDQLLSSIPEGVPKRISSLRRLLTKKMVEIIDNQLANKKTNLQDLIMSLGMPEDMASDHCRLSVVGNLVLYNEQLSWDEKIKLTQRVQQNIEHMINKGTEGVNLLEFFEKIIERNKDEELKEHKKFPYGAKTDVLSPTQDMSFLGPQQLMQLAAKYADEFTVDFLLQEGVSPDAEANHLWYCGGDSPLGAAVAALKLDIVKRLIVAGAKITDDVRKQAKKQYKEIHGRFEEIQNGAANIGSNINKPIRGGLSYADVVRFAEADKEQAKGILHVLGIKDIED